jgi:uncharacterized protein (DUF4415 family)
MKRSVSSRRDGPTVVKDKATGETLVRYVVDLNNPPPLTAKLRAELEALAARSDDDIDYSDIPPLDEKFWKNAVRNPLFKPVKQQLTLRLDADLIAWFKRRAGGERGYQTRINRALRDYVEQQEKKAG